MLSIWWWYVESYLVLWERVFAMTRHSLGRALSLCPASFCTPRPVTALQAVTPVMAITAALSRPVVSVSDPRDCSPPGSFVHGILRQEHCSGLQSPPPWDLPSPGIGPSSSTLQASSLLSEPPRNLLVEDALKQLWFLLSIYVKKILFEPWLHIPIFWARKLGLLCLVYFFVKCVYWVSQKVCSGFSVTCYGKTGMNFYGQPYIIRKL